MNILEDIKLILLFQLIYQLQNARSSFEDSGTDVDESQEQNESKSSAASSEEHSHSHRHHYVHRAGHRYKKSRSHSHQHKHNHEHEHVRATSNEYIDDCECSCSKCNPPSECCKNACNTCPGSSSVVFVPYPYPMMMPNLNERPASTQHEVMRARETSPEPTSTTTSTTTSATTTTTSTTTTTTTTEDPNDLMNSQRNNNMLESVLKSVVEDYTNIIAKTPEKLQNGHNKYMLTSLRRTKPTWMPKFGIVPINDNIAEKLMSKIKMSGVALRSQQKRVPTYDKSYLRTLDMKN